MKAKRHGKATATGVAFWDTSAIVPLCFFQRQSAQANQTLRSYRKQITWWATAVEAISSRVSGIRTCRLTSWVPADTKRVKMTSTRSVRPSRNASVAAAPTRRASFDRFTRHGRTSLRSPQIAGVGRATAVSRVGLVSASPAGPHVHCGGRKPCDCR